MIFIVLALLGLGLEAVLKVRRQSIVDDAQYELYIVRDELRSLMRVSREQMLPSTWLFSYLDHTLSKVAGKLSSITLYSTFISYIQYKYDEDIIIARERLNRELDSFPVLAELVERFEGAMSAYFYQRHFLIIGTASCLGKIFHKLAEWESRTRRDVLSILGSSPETSTLSTDIPT